MDGLQIQTVARWWWSNRRRRKEPSWNLFWISEFKRLGKVEIKCRRERGNEKHLGIQKWKSQLQNRHFRLDWLSVFDIVSFILDQGHTAPAHTDCRRPLICQQLNCMFMWSCERKGRKNIIAINIISTSDQHQPTAACQHPAVLLPTYMSIIQSSVSTWADNWMMLTTPSMVIMADEDGKEHSTSSQSWIKIKTRHLQSDQFVRSRKSKESEWKKKSFKSDCGYSVWISPAAQNERCLCHHTANFSDAMAYDSQCTRTL